MEVTDRLGQKQDKLAGVTTNDCSNKDSGCKDVGSESRNSRMRREVRIFQSSQMQRHFLLLLNYVESIILTGIPMENMLVLICLHTQTNILSDDI